MWKVYWTSAFSVFWWLCVDSPSLVWITGVILFFISLEDVEKQTAHSDLIWPVLFYSWCVHPANQNWWAIGLIGGISWLAIRHSWLGSGDLPVLLLIGSQSLSFIAPCLLIASCTALVWLIWRHTARVAFLPFLSLGWYCLILWQ